MNGRRIGSLIMGLVLVGSLTFIGQGTLFHQWRLMGVSTELMSMVGFQRTSSTGMAITMRWMGTVGTTPCTATAVTMTCGVAAMRT